MGGHSVAEIRGEMRRYWVVGTALFLLTGVTVGVSYLQVSVGMAVLIALIIAGIKGSLVAGVFMHLLSERQAIYSLLLVTILFFAILMIGPLGARAGGLAVGWIVMSLRAFHVFFVALSVVMSLVVAAWGAHDYHHHGDSGGLALSVLCFVLGSVLVVYGIKVYKKLFALGR